MPRDTVSVVLPVYNEETIIGENLKELKAYLDSLELRDYQILLVENGSTDDTYRICTGFAKNNEHVDVLRLSRPSWGDAVICGFSKSKYDPVLYPIDLTFNLDFIEKSLKEEYDIVLGSRYLPGSKTDRPLVRTVVSRFHTPLMNCLFGTSYTDLDGLKLVKKEVAHEICKEVRSKSSFFETEFLVLAHKKGYSWGEIPVSHVEKRESKFNFKTLVIDFFPDLVQNWRKLRN